MAAVSKGGVESQAGRMLTAALHRLSCVVPDPHCIVTPLNARQRGRAVKRRYSLFMSSLTIIPF